MNIGWVGDKGQGKSYLLAKQLVRILKRNQIWHEKYELPKRPVCVMTTLGLSDWFVEQWTEYLVFFTEIQQLALISESDVFVDDISMRLDSRNWELLPQDTREWLYGSERLGCDLYFTAQKFSRVEITFRLLTDAVYVCTKGWGSPRPSATRPEVKRVWGIIFENEVPKSEYQKESFNQDEWSGGGRWHWLSKRYTSVYDHTNVTLTQGYAPLRCIVRECSDPNCPEVKKNNGQPHLKYKHV